MGGSRHFRPRDVTVKTDTSQAERRCVPGVKTRKKINIRDVLSLPPVNRRLERTVRIPADRASIREFVDLPAVLVGDEMFENRRVEVDSGRVPHDARRRYFCFRRRLNRTRWSVDSFSTNQLF